ncbi:MAG TPA: YggT family protein [Anaerolineales bacterium]
MEFVILAQLVDLIAQILILLIFVSVILSFFMSPYHPVRQAIDRIIEPLLAPIRRIVPLVGMFDFSPLILMLLIQVVDWILTSILRSL